MMTTLTRDFTAPATRTDEEVDALVKAHLLNNPPVLPTPPAPSVSYIRSAAVVTCYTNLQWASVHGNTYSDNNGQANQNAGVGSNITPSFAEQGMLLPQGATLNKLELACRAGSAQLTDFEVLVAVKTPSNVGGWPEGVGSTAHLGVVEVARVNFVDPNTTGDMLDLRAVNIPLGNYVLPSDSMVNLYIKPIGTLTWTQYLTINWTFEVSAPSNPSLGGLG